MSGVVVKVADWHHTSWSATHTAIPRPDSVSVRQTHGTHFLAAICATCGEVIVPWSGALTSAPKRAVLVADWAERRDHYGRVQFTAWWWPGRWWNEAEPAGQVFHGVPEEYAAAFERKGYEVSVEESGWEPT